MKSQRHSRKEFITILFVSNTGGKNKEYHIARPLYNLFRFVPFIIAAGFLTMAAFLYFNYKELATLRTQLEPYRKQIEQLETSQESLSAENEADC